MFAVPDFATYLAAWAASITGIGLLFSSLDTVVPCPTRRRIGEFLRNTEVRFQWNESFVDIFDTIFGKACFTPRRLLMSAVISTIFSVVMYLVWRSFQPEAYALIVREVGIVEPAVMAVVFLVLLNWIPDYVSLQETRWLLTVMQAGRGFPFFVVIVVDALLTFLVWVAWLTFVWVIFDVLDLQFFPELSFHNYLRSIDAAVFFIGDKKLIATFLSVYLYTTFFTSIWLWLYALSTWIIRFLHRLISAFQRAISPLDLESKPFTSIGVVSMAITTLLFAAIPVTRLAVP